MDLQEKYRGLYLGALFVVEEAESAYRLGALDRGLKAWVREEIEGREHSLDYCDSQLDLAHAVEGLSAIAPRYVKLRRQLFSDLHHIGPEPPWRPMEGATAVRAGSRVFVRHPSYVLHRIRAGAGLEAESWEFTVFTEPHKPDDEGVTFRVMVFPDDHGGTLQVSPELEAQRSWYEQLAYGLLALDRTPRLAALSDPGS
ncbi:hypothetical protein [Promicromonospora sp. NPDC060271]|uniref:hypothetical protein n=1 Tax=Promicromonospora sp. NPDC060271 TaxID=3347089 RepID=UPI00364FF665